MLIGHEGRWYMDKHYTDNRNRRCSGTLYGKKCPCCIARWIICAQSCDQCGFAWRLSAVSKYFMDVVVAHGMSQPRWWTVFTPEERRERRAAIRGKGYKPTCQQSSWGDSNRRQSQSASSRSAGRWVWQTDGDETHDAPAPGYVPQDAPVPYAPVPCGTFGAVPPPVAEDERQSDEDENDWLVCESDGVMSIERL